MLAIRRTFEVITPESAEHGDADRRGWTDAHGYEYASDPAAAPEPEIVTPVRGLPVRAAAKRLGVSPSTAQRWLAKTARP